MVQDILQQSRKWKTSKNMKITNECNMQLMARYPDNHFDLAIVDPPYGINASNMQMGSHPNRSKNDGYGSGPAISTAVKLKGRLNTGSGKLKNRILNQSNIGWDNKVPDDRYFEELFRVSKNQVIWGGNYFKLKPTRCILAWNKLQPWENFSQFEMAWTSFDKPAGLISLSNTGGANNQVKIHPTQKPVKLYSWVLNRLANEGDKILDTHLGSGSIAIACHNLKYDLTASELDKEYYDAAMKRIDQHKQQLTLY